MAKKQYFAIIDTETTMADTVADCAIVVCDRQGVIHNQMAVLVQGHYGVNELFHDKKANDIWGYAGLEKRKANYTAMLENGSRMVASVNAINRWVAHAIGKYNPTLTAYNLPFDDSKCANTGIDLSGFADRFCLWSAAVGNICNTKAYKQFCVENHLFTNRTGFGNMSLKTSAESVTGFLNGSMTDEPHTALEDIIGYELPTLKIILAKKNWKEKVIPYNWREFQVKDHVKAK